MQNFSDITRAFLAKNAAVQVKSPEELERVIGDLLGDAPHRAALGRAALDVVTENLGAVERTVEMILPHLERRGIFVGKKN